MKRRHRKAEWARPSLLSAEIPSGSENLSTSCQSRRVGRGSVKVSAGFPRSFSELDDCCEFEQVFVCLCVCVCVCVVVVSIVYKYIYIYTCALVVLWLCVRA